MPKHLASHPVHHCNRIDASFGNIKTITAKRDSRRHHAAERTVQPILKLRTAKWAQRNLTEKCLPVRSNNCHGVTMRQSHVHALNIGCQT